MHRNTGRSTERPVLSEEQIERNVQGIRRILQQLIGSGNGAGPVPTILNNLVCPSIIHFHTYHRDRLHIHMYHVSTSNVKFFPHLKSEI